MLKRVSGTISDFTEIMRVIVYYGIIVLEAYFCPVILGNPFMLTDVD